MMKIIEQENRQNKACLNMLRCFTIDNKGIRIWATRFSQKATAINLTGLNSKNIAYQLERKLFDTGHATTVLENQSDDALLTAIKDEGLICLLVEAKSSTDYSFDCDEQSIDDIYSTLKAQQIIY